jgi:hypothetical protein
MDKQLIDEMSTFLISTFKQNKIEFIVWTDLKEKRPPKGVLFIVTNTTCEAPWVSVRSLGQCDEDIDPTGLLWYSPDDNMEPLHYTDVTHWAYMPDPPLI